MDTQPRHFDLSMKRNALFKVSNAAGMHIVCLEGSVWITLDNDYNDYVLQAGDTFSTTKQTRALIHAMRASSIAVTAGIVEQSSSPRRQAGAPHGLVFEQVLA